MLIKRIVYSILIIISCVPALSFGQVVWERSNNTVIPFLSRQAQKGNISIDDFILPLSRKTIAEKLQNLADSIQKLTEIEREELQFYQKEYSEFNPSRDSTILLKRDQHGRLRFLTVNNGDNLLRGDPVIGLETFLGKGKSIIKSSSGLQFWGHIGKNLSFQSYFSEITEYGTLLDTIKQFTNETGIVRTANINPGSNMLNYTELRGHVTYAMPNGSLSFGKDQILWGYGENGRIIMSDKSPAYPYLRLDYQPAKWLKFHYAHAWLQSGIIDSARSYYKNNDIYGDVREMYVPKYMATHSLNLFPLRGISLSLGESVIYSDRLDVGYLIPIIFFKAYDQYASRYKISTGSNSQFFFQASSRNNIPNTHLYANLFIDEIRLTEAFNSAKSRNQFGFNIGASVTDLFANYLTVGLEYTRLNPFVYQNLIPTQNYSNHNYLIGDWIGQNADRITAWVKYNPKARLNTSIKFNYIRKGELGSLEDQYYAEPQPKFLSGSIDAQKQLLVEIKYEIINQLRIYGFFMKQAGIINPVLQPSAIANEFRFGITYGL
jgi:hypothetical protein